MGGWKFQLQAATILLIFCCTTNSHRILGLFPHPGISHFQFFHPVMKALAEAGHEVTVVSQFPSKQPIENYRDEPLSGKSDLTNFVNLDVSFKINILLLNDLFMQILFSVQWFANPKPYDHLLEFFMLRQWGVEACEFTLNSSAIKNILNLGRREPFDLIIVEQFNSDCMLGVAHRLKAPVIGLSSCNIMPWHFPRIGLPYEPGFYPTTFIEGSDDMSFMKRLSNWFTFVYMNVMYRNLVQRDTNVLLRKRFGDDFPDLEILTKKVSMMFVNQHYSLSGAKHLGPNVVELGGIHIEKANQLDPVSEKKFLLSRPFSTFFLLFRNFKIFSTRPNMASFTSASARWFVLTLYQKKNAKQSFIHSENSSSEFCGNGKMKLYRISRRTCLSVNGCRNVIFYVRIAS
jgi:glucuronosyltransferase